MKYFFSALYRGFISPEWLSKQRSEVRRASWFFVLMVLVLSIGVGARFYFREIPMVGILGDSIVREVPEFHATFSKGMLSITELEQPYIRSVTLKDNTPLKIIVDTVSTSTLSLDMFATSTEAALLVTRDGVVTNDPSIFGSTKESFARAPDSSFGKNDVVELLENITERWKFGIVAVITALTFFFWGIGLLIYLLIYSALVYVVYTRTTKTEPFDRYTWKEVLRLCIFSLALPKIIITALALTFTVSIPYIVTIAMIIPVLRALTVKKDMSEQQMSSEPPRI